MKCLGVFVAIIAFQCISASPLIGGFLGGVLKPVQSVVGLVQPVVGIATNTVSELNVLGNLTGVLSEIARSLIRVIGGLLGSLSSIVGTVEGTTLSTVAGPLGNVLSTVAGLAGTPVQILGNLDSLLYDIFPTLNDLVSSLNGDFGFVNEALNSVQSTLANLFNIITSLNSGLDSDTIENAVGAVGYAAAILFKALAEAGLNDGASAAVVEAFAALTFIVSTVIAVVGIALVLAVAVIQIVVGFSSEAVKTVVFAVSNASELLNGVCATISVIFNNAANEASGLTSDIIDISGGLFASVTSAIDVTGSLGV